MIDDDPSPILLNPHFLEENHIPPDLISRDEHSREISFCIDPAIKGKRPIHVWIHGNPGTGKTATCKHIMNQLKELANLKTTYVNCWENNTYHSVLDKIVRELRMLGAEKLNKSFKIERLKLFLGEKPFIIFLDETDQLPHKERDNLLYNFSNIKNVSIVSVCNSKYIYHSLDERIKSRLAPKLIEFLPYSINELTNILKQRAGVTLSPGSFSDRLFHEIAKLAEGDGRIAIQILKNAAYFAESEKAKKISMIHVHKGYSTAKSLKKTYLLNKLTKHHRMLYNLIKDNQPILSGNLWKLYLKRCKKARFSPIALRTFSEYMRKLIETDLVKSERALVRGKVRIFRTN